MELALRATLIAQNGDLHSEPIAAELTQRGFTVDILNLGNAAHQYQISGPISDPSIETETSTFTFESVRRGPILLSRFRVDRQVEVDAPANDFAGREWKSAFESIFSSWELRSERPWLISNSVFAVHNQKLALLGAVQRSGALVPKTHVLTRVPESFPRNMRWVAKSLNSWQEVAPGKFFNTHLLESAEFDLLQTRDLDGPIFIQEYLQHSQELRVYIAGNTGFGVRVESHDERIVDFRLLTHENSDASIASIPTELRSVLERAMGIMGLNYCAFDVILNKDGRYFVTDVNPLGSWNHLENIYGLSLTNRIINGALNL